MNEIIPQIKNGLIVSCQTEENEPFDKPEFVTKFALAAEFGGAAAIRTQGIENIKAIHAATKLPLIGTVDGKFSNGWICITPDFKDIESIISAGADIVALDVTPRKRPNGMDGIEFFEEARGRFVIPFVADISTFEEGIRAAEMGADAIATTLSGYTEYTQKTLNDEPNFELIEELAHAVKIPVIAQGRIWTPEQARKALMCGAFSVVAGSAITRPRIITKRFVDILHLTVH